MRRAVAPAAGALALVALAAGAVAWVQAIRRETRTPVDLAEVGYVTSEQCIVCHPRRHETWSRTFHRTMTQRAGPGSVVGDFADASLSYRGVTSRFVREGDRYWIETLAPSGAMERFEVVMTVGSRRIQQYVTKIGDRHWRLPLAWNIEERRWIHLNGGFLHPDGADFNTHLALWDVNCIFCHNVKAQPRFDDATDTFHAHVEELGIACEACHGPGALHVRRNANPLRRYALYAGGRDPTVHSPEEMTPERQVQLCGHCHGQRLPNPPQRIAEFLTVGDPYTAGDDLGRFTAPLDIHSELPDVDLSLRFWKDGTPRLTAYEYQGVLTSEGHRGTKLSCISCHDMHGGDPRGMIHEEMRGNQGCVQCHGDMREGVDQHTRHAVGSSGGNCYACHMPPITYGLLAIHPTHRIQNPEPARVWRHDMPEACTLCHADRTAPWAAAEMSRQYGTPLPGDMPEARAFHVAESVRSLFAGDVVQRAVAVNALSQPASYTTDPVARLWAAPFLILTLEDRYPAIRHFAWRGLVRLAERARARARLGALPDFDYLAEPDARARAVDACWRWWEAVDRRRIPHPGSAVPLDGALMPIGPEVSALRAAQGQQVIAIGE